MHLGRNVCVPACPYAGQKRVPASAANTHTTTGYTHASTPVTGTPAVVPTAVPHGPDGVGMGVCRC